VVASEAADTVVGVVLVPPLTDSCGMLPGTHVEMVHLGVAALAPHRKRMHEALVVMSHDVVMNYDVKLVAA